jgi:hypothetical protein
MRSTEGRKEVVQHVFVGQVDDCKLQVCLVPICVQDVIQPDANVEEMARSDTRRIGIVVLGSRSWNPKARGAIFRKGQGARSNGIGQTDEVTSAEKSNGGLLICIQPENGLLRERQMYGEMIGVSRVLSTMLAPQ